MSDSLFYQLCMCAVVTAINLYSLEASGILSLHAMTSFYDLNITLLTTFVFCYFSEKLSTDLYGIAEIFYDSMWYRLPAKQQILVIFAIQHSQREFRLSGFGIINCSLGTFFTVILLIGDILPRGRTRQGKFTPGIAISE